MNINNFMFLWILTITLCGNSYSCVTDVDVFSWKNTNLKGIRVVEFDAEQKRFLRITYHYNLEENSWCPLRTSNKNPQRAILSGKSNGEVLFDDTEFQGSIMSSSYMYTSTLLPEMSYPSSIFSDHSMEGENKSKNRYFVYKKGTLGISIPSVSLYDIGAQQVYTETTDQLIPDSFLQRCVNRRNTHNMQMRTTTSQATFETLQRDGLKLLNFDRNNEKGSLGELAITLCMAYNNYKCKLSIKNEDEHHGTYDGAYIPADTNQPRTLILTESKYKTGDPGKLVSRFAQDYYFTFQKLWNSQGENAAFKRKAADIMRFMALQPIQDIRALINIGSPMVQLSWYKIFVDPSPFYFILYNQPYNNVRNDDLALSMPIQPGITFENMKKLVSLAYQGTNSKKGESLVSINQWFGFTEKYPKGGFKYVLKNDMKKLSVAQMNIIAANFSVGINKLLDSNSLTKKQKDNIKKIAGI